VTRTSYGRGICPECESEFDLVKSRTLRQHKGDARIGGRRQVCDGSGLRPARMVSGFSADDLLDDARDLALHLAQLLRRVSKTALSELDPDLAEDILPDWMTGDNRGNDLWMRP
jgi:hypothetical protein